MRILFVSKENKNNDFILNNFFSSVSVFITCLWEYHDACVCVMPTQEPAFRHRTSISLSSAPVYSGSNKWGWAKNCKSSSLSSCLQRLFYVQCASSTCKQGSAHVCSMLECWLMHQQHHTHVSWYSRECMSKTDTQEKKLLNKVIFFFAHKMYSHSFIKLNG